jgi:hypothetical protein
VKLSAGGHIIANQHMETALGVAAFLAGWLLLHDAYDRRGRNQPPLMRPFTWW